MDRSSSEEAREKSAGSRRRSRRPHLTVTKHGKQFVNDALQRRAAYNPASGPALLLAAAELSDAAVLFVIEPARVIGIKDHGLRKIIGVHQPAQFRRIDDPVRNF
jgi:hypothetical protein